MKHKCPYLNSKNECSHKMNNLEKQKRLVRCPYNNPEKCRWYNLWLKERNLSEIGLKRLRGLFQKGDKNEV